MAERMRRVNEIVREVVAEAIPRDLEDPRIGWVTVTSVDTSPDLRHAKIWVSVLGDEEEREATLAALESSHGVLQRAIAQEMTIKHTPSLRLLYDDAPERVMRLAHLLEGDDAGEADEIAGEISAAEGEEKTS